MRLDELSEFVLVEVRSAVCRAAGGRPDRRGHDGVVDDLGHDLGKHIAAARFRGRGARHAQDGGADGVDRPDRRGVELDECPFQPLGFHGPLVRHGEKPGIERVIAGDTRWLQAAEQPRHGHDPGPDPVFQFGGGRPGVGGDEDVADPQGRILGERERDQRGYGVSLARSGARLDQRAVGWQVGAEVELDRHENVYSLLPCWPVRWRHDRYRSRNTSSGDSAAKMSA